MITIAPLTFKTILRLIEVDGYNKDGPIVKYQFVDEQFTVSRGVYIVTIDDQIVYCGKFSSSFNKRWLFTKDKYVYHFKRNLISDAILAKHKVEVHAQDENTLKSHWDNLIMTGLVSLVLKKS